MAQEALNSRVGRPLPCMRMTLVRLVKLLPSTSFRMCPRRAARKPALQPILCLMHSHLVPGLQSPPPLLCE